MFTPSGTFSLHENRLIFMNPETSSPFNSPEVQKKEVPKNLDGLGERPGVEKKTKEKENVTDEEKQKRNEFRDAQRGRATKLSEQYWDKVKGHVDLKNCSMEMQVDRIAGRGRSSPDTLHYRVYITRIEPGGGKENIYQNILRQKDADGEVSDEKLTQLMDSAVEKAIGEIIEKRSQKTALNSIEQQINGLA